MKTSCPTPVEAQSYPAGVSLTSNQVVTICSMSPLNWYCPTHPVADCELPDWAFTHATVSAAAWL